MSLCVGAIVAILRDESTHLAKVDFCCLFWYLDKDTVVALRVHTHGSVGNLDVSHALFIFCIAIFSSSLTFCILQSAPVCYFIFML